jgi:hypothetical protein
MLRVMAGLGPTIHVFRSAAPKDVDARNECGHDDVKNGKLRTVRDWKRLRCQGDLR